MLCPFFIYETKSTDYKNSRTASGQAFGEFELTSEKDIDMLVYSFLVSNSDENFSYSTYKHLSKKVKAKALRQLTSDFLSFSNSVKKKQRQNQNRCIWAR